MPRVYIVQQGDDGASIAARFGFAAFAKIWDDPANAALKKTRPDVGVLYPGDEVTIPDLEKKSVTAKEKALNKFRVTLPVRLFDVTMQDQHGKPSAGLPYKL